MNGRKKMRRHERDNFEFFSASRPALPASILYLSPELLPSYSSVLPWGHLGLLKGEKRFSPSRLSLLDSLLSETILLCQLQNCRGGWAAMMTLCGARRRNRHEMAEPKQGSYGACRSITQIMRASNSKHLRCAIYRGCMEMF